MTAALDRVEAVRSRLNDVLKGKQDVVQHVLVCLLARGHLLLEDRPGLGKTTLAKALADAVGGRFARIQCTPDLLPSDITGFNIFNQKDREFEFRRGPVFSDILLADEINRATPRTQSAPRPLCHEARDWLSASRRRASDARGGGGGCRRGPPR
jgi:MoxR-like ATPase